MHTLRWVLAGTLGVLLGLGLLVSPPAHSQQILQQGFEARGPYWKPGSSDAKFKVVSHALTEETAHFGKSEHIRLQVEKGSYIHYTFDVPKAPITEELNFVLWLKSNRPGVQLFCRVVLPRERDPKDLQSSLSVLVKCDPYLSSRWKLLTLRQPVKRLREQQQLLAHQQNRAIDTTGAYIDQIVLNVFDGPGLTDVYIDDLEIGPVFREPVAIASPSPKSAVPGRGMALAKGDVQLKGSQLWVDGKRFFMIGIRHTGTPLHTLQEAGFNTVWMDASTSDQAVAEAASLGLRIVPSLVPPETLTNRGTLEALLTSNGNFKRSVSRFLEQDAVLAWDLGNNLGVERFSGAVQLASSFRTMDPQRPVLGDIWDGYQGYSRGLDSFLVGTHRWPLMTSLELSAYRDWLMARRRLSEPAYTWTWIQTHVPDWFVNLARLAKDGENFTEPIGPHPEQIRLLTYCALGAGYRGVAFWSDKFLADSHQGRDRLLAMALLNQELRLLEPLLVSSTTPEWVDTSRPEVKAAVFRGPDGILVLPMWLGVGSQFVPGQAASPELVITVPGVPNTATAWEVSPGRMQAYAITREVAGSQVRLKNFSLTSAILFTSDLQPNGLVVRLQDRQRGMVRLAAQYLHDQAKEELVKVEKIDGELNQLGHPLQGSADLLKQCRKSLDDCNAHRRNGEHGEAFTQAEIALRSLRVIMRGHWDRATRDLDHPVSSPFAVSFFTLPRHYRLLDRIAQSRLGANVLKDGDFEVDPERAQTGWFTQEVPSLDDVEVRVRRVKDSAHTGKQSLMMKVTPKTPLRIPAALQRTYVALHSPAVKLPPGTLVRITVWIRIPVGVNGSPDGAMFFDSVGGEPLSFRITRVLPKWKRYAVYREVPASGLINVSLAMSGMGTVYFDDVRIEPLEPTAIRRAKP
jgi:hypothetical protein